MRDTRSLVLPGSEVTMRMTFVGYSSLLKTAPAVDAMTVPNANAMRQELVILFLP
jgi:hypothetical protein